MTGPGWLSKCLGLQGVLQLLLNPPVQLPLSEGLREFLEHGRVIGAALPFELLEPPASVGFLRLALGPAATSSPVASVMPPSFAVNGFTVLVNGAALTPSRASGSWCGTWTGWMLCW